MLIGAFYARHVSHGSIPPGWASTVLAQLWPAPDVNAARGSISFASDDARNR